MTKVKEFLIMIWNLWYTKYLVVCFIGILVVGFLDENSVMSHVNNMNRISELQKEIKFYNDQNQQNKRRIRDMETNPKAVEKIARERYFMKADDEDIFVLSDDEQIEPAAVNQLKYSFKEQ